MQGKYSESATIATKLARQTAVVGSLVLCTTTAPITIGVSPSYAACDPIIANNVVAVCTGDTVNQNTPVGYGASGITNITVDVRPGATVTGDSIGVFGSTFTSLTNNGAISGGFQGIGSTTLSSLINNGTIYGGTGAGVGGTTITSLINSGTITTGAGALAAVSSVNITSLTNSGTISGGSRGISGDTLTSLTNSGTISGEDDGIRANTAITSLTNSGTISGGTYGILSATIASLTNSGTIEGGTLALYELGAVDTSLTLNAGSVLIGRVDLGGGTNTLNIGEGLSLTSMFEADSDIILGTTGGQLVAIDTSGGVANQVVVAVDPSAFTSFDDALAALTTGIGQTVQGRQSALRSDPALGFAASFASRFAAAEETRLAAFSDLNLDNTQPLSPSRFWIEGFGAYREDDSDRVGRTFESLTGGLVAGVDVPLDAITSVGVMAGFAAGTSENETDTQETDTMSYYAGVYASTEAWGLAWDGAITLGYTDYDQERITANNLVATGLETASADFGGWFINPQVTVTNSTSTGLSPTATRLMGFALPTVEQSLTLAYAGLFLDGTTETGTTNPLTLDDRAVHIASARAALALPFEALHADGALTTIRLIGGVEARAQFGDDAISGTLLGQTVSTTLDDDDATLGGFLGLSGEHQTSSGLTAYANAEALLETNSAYQISATAGLRIAF